MQGLLDLSMFLPSSRAIFRIPLSLLFLLLGQSHAHEHHTVADPSGPLDTLIILHICVQFLVWCILFPIGLIYGFTRARWHVPLQATGFLLTIGGYVLGHKHGGRTFPNSLHAVFASVIIAPIVSQLVLGVYLKLHINEGTPFRSWMVFSHRIVGLSYLSFGWIQVLLGTLVLGNICPLKEDTPLVKMAQCSEPFFTGTFLMQYGLYSYLFHLILPRWRGQSPETWDSLILCLSGVIFGTAKYWLFGLIWIELLWLVGGLVSVLLSRNGRRTILPSIIIIVTGFVETFQRRDSTDQKVAPSFGALLVLGGAIRILEITLMAKRKLAPHSNSCSVAKDGYNWSAAVSISFLSAGLVYMTSSEELLRITGLGPVNSLSYLAFMLGLCVGLAGFVLILGHLFQTSGRNANKISNLRDDERGRKFVVEESDDEETNLRRGDEAYELEGPSRTVDSDDEIR